MRVKFSSNNIAQRVLDEVTRECFAMSTEAAHQVAGEILVDASGRAPVKTGTLKKSGRTYLGKDNTKAGRGLTRKQVWTAVKMTFGVRRRKRRSGKYAKGRADYAAIVHNNKKLKLRRGEHQFLYRAVARRVGRLRNVIRSRWRQR